MSLFFDMCLGFFDALTRGVNSKRPIIIDDTLGLDFGIRLATIVGVCVVGLWKKDFFICSVFVSRIKKSLNVVQAFFLLKIILKYKLR